MSLFALLLSSFIAPTSSWTSPPFSTSMTRSRWSRLPSPLQPSPCVESSTLHAVDVSQLPPAVSYQITAGPPLGLILTEFESTVKGVEESPEGATALTPLLVSDVSEGGSAARLGVREGDVLCGLNGLSLLAPGLGFETVMSAIKAEVRVCARRGANDVYSCQLTPPSLVAV